MSTQHATPFFCPYCGEQDIHPTADDRAWYCKTCDRSWKLEFLGLGRADAGRPKED